jgi:hypothetical protein
MQDALLMRIVDAYFIVQSNDQFEYHEVMILNGSIEKWKICVNIRAIH